MGPHAKIPRLLACGVSAALVFLAFCVATKAEEALDVEGRLSLLDHGDEEWLVLLARDGQSYKVTGKLQPRLKKTLSSTGEKNLVAVKGIRAEKSLVPCAVSRDLVHDEKGNKVFKSAVRCITYFPLEVTHIISQGISPDIMPEPLRDAQQEKLLASAVGEHKPTPAIVGEISGRIKATAPRKPVKSIEVESRDKTRTLTVLITPETRIVRIIGGSEPVPVTAENLQPGQEVSVMYKRQELRTEATYITITKE